MIPALHTAARDALVYEARETLSVNAWIAVQRITPEIAAQEPQAVAEMIAHLRRVQGGEA